MNRFETLWPRVVQEIPGARIVKRSDFWLTRWMGKRYDNFTTTIWRTCYVSSQWDTRSSDDRYKTLRHELQHLRQFRNWPFKSLGRRYLWPINAVIMSLCYLLVLPVFWTLRAKFERAGYEQTLLVEYELGGLRTPEDQKSWIDWLTETFGGSTYAWMWTRNDAREWAKNTIMGITSGTITNEKDRV